LARGDAKNFVRKDSEGYGLVTPAFFHLIQVPKNRLAVRPAVVQDSLSRLLYATAVASNLGRLCGALPEWVFGWRPRGTASFAKNGAEWSSYVEHLAAAPQDDLAGLQVDIASCFASVTVERLAE